MIISVHSYEEGFYKKEQAEQGKKGMVQRERETSSGMELNPC